MNLILKIVLKIVITLILLLVMVFAGGSWTYLPGGVSLILTLIVLSLIVTVWVPRKKIIETKNPFNNLKADDSYDNEDNRNDTQSKIEDIKSKINEIEVEIELVIKSHKDNLITREKSIDIINILRNKIRTLKSDKQKLEALRIDNNISKLAEKNVYDKIRNLEQLKIKGYINEIDFESKKEELINSEINKIKNDSTNSSYISKGQEELINEETYWFRMIFFFGIIIILILVVVSISNK
jgi:K+ transporter